MKVKLFTCLTTILAASVAGFAASSCPEAAHTSWDVADAEYLESIRPGTCGKNPFWNGFALKFIYAPAFDFPEVPGAVSYRFTLEDRGTVVEPAPRHYQTLTEDPQAWFVPVDGAPTGRKWSFVADSPKADLSPVWNSLPVAMMHLYVQGVDAAGNDVGTASERVFLRDFPFHGPYHEAVRPYRKAAMMAAMFVHTQAPMQHWLTSAEPDMTYRHNTYASKIISATISHECLLARMIPQLRDEALAIARNSAAFLISVSKKPGEPLAYFPPTYYKEFISSGRPENKGKAMMMEGCPVGEAFLDLYDATAEKEYFDRALHIADTYVSMQAEDGSLPIKLDFQTGEPVNNCRAMLTPLMCFFSRIEKQYGIKTYAQAREKAEQWMQTNAMSRFDMTGQFEDMTVLGQKPYQNLTDCASSPYASYILKKEGHTAEDLENARDLVRFSEDQFVSWDELPDRYGRTCLNTPSVVEQYGYRVPIDNSSAVVAESFLDMYEATGNRLWFEKAKALVDNLTIVQNALDGQIPTSLDMRSGAKNKIRGYWVNCTLASERILLRMAELTEKQEIDLLHESFVKAAVANASPSEEVTANFIKYSEQGRANDVLLLQLYTSVALPDAEVERLLGLWKGDTFSDIDYADKTRGRWQPTLHVTRIQALAKLYADPSSKWYRDSRLHGLIHNGIDWWFANMPVCPNWWHNDIGVPKKMTSILLMIKEELSPEQIAGGVRVLERSAFGRTGQNKAWLAGNQLMKGILTGDLALVKRSRDVISEEISITDGTEGIRDDWSFHQHGPQMQFGNYGLAYLEGLSFWLRVLEGTPYQFSEEQCGIIENLLRKGIGLCVWKGVMDPSYCGRQVFPDGGRGKAYSMAVAATNLEAYALRKGDAAAAESYRAMALQNLEPEGYPNAITGAVWFPRSDCGLYRAKDWYASVRMSSERTIGYEFTNRENTLAHFSASGAVLLMRSGDEYDNVFACWDWRKVPGVTAYDDGRPIRSSDRTADKQNNSRDVGGDVCHGPGNAPSENADTLRAHMQIDRDSLFAYKTVTITPSYILEQGRDIYTLNPDVKCVTTAVDQTLLCGKVRRGKLRCGGGNQLSREWVWHNGVGYISLDGSPFHLFCGEQTGDWGAIDPALSGRKDSCQIFKLWIEHPEALCGAEGRASYNFVILPGVTAKQTSRMAKTWKH